MPALRLVSERWPTILGVVSIIAYFVKARMFPSKPFHAEYHGNGVPGPEEDFRLRNEFEAAKNKGWTTDDGLGLIAFISTAGLVLQCLNVFGIWQWLVRRAMMWIPHVGREETSSRAPDATVQCLPSSFATSALVNSLRSMRKIAYWDHRHHSRVFRVLETRSASILARIMALLEVFDATTPNGLAMIESIERIIQGHFPAGLPDDLAAREASVQEDLVGAWNNIKEYFEELLPNVVEDENQERHLHDIRKERRESLLELLSRFRHIRTTVAPNVSEIKAVEILLGKVPVEFQNVLKTKYARQELSLEILMDEAKQFTTWTRMSNDRSRYSSHVREVSTAELEDQALSHEDTESCNMVVSFDNHDFADLFRGVSVEESARQELSNRLRRFNESRPNSSASGSIERSMSRVRCHRCHKYGHVAAQCPLRQVRQPSRGDQDASKVYHLGNGQRKALQAKCFIGPPESERVKLVTLIDTGADVNICPLDTLRRQGWLLKEDVKKSVKGYNGKEEQSNGQVDLIVTLGHKDHKVTFDVLASCSKLILGIPALSDMRATVDCHEGKIHLPKNVAVMCNIVRGPSEGTSRSDLNEGRHLTPLQMAE